MRIIISILLISLSLVVPASAKIYGTTRPVPFTSQAPQGQWHLSIFQDGCEETSLLIAHHWLTGKPFGSPQAATREIEKITAFEYKSFGHYVDLSTDDAATLFKTYFHYDGAFVQHDISREDIIREIKAGHLVIVPAHGHILRNPYYTPPGPDRHMLVVYQYDSTRDQFITNDPGTRRGKGYRYSTKLLYKSIREYPTGTHLPIVVVRKSMIVVKPKPKNP